MSFDMKMLVVDIDGTIMNKEFKISENVINCIKRLTTRGIKVVLATGRMYNATKQVASQLQIDTPVICYQGALIVDSKNDEIMYQNPIGKKVAKLVINYLRMTKFHINLYKEDTLYVEKDNHYIQKYALERKIGYVVLDSFDDIDLNDVHKLLAVDNDPEKVAVLVKKLNEAFGNELVAVKSMPKFCEITDKTTSKGNAIAYLASKYDIKKSQIMGIGDQDNDIDMIKSVGVGVAMGNATANLKSVADFITKSIDEDGMVYAVREYLRR